VRTLWTAWISALALLVAGCGGGGGGGGGGGSVSGPTGFVPAAPTLGAVLYDQAAALRPLRAGARWSYRVADYTNGGRGIATVTQTAGATAGTFVEADSSTGVNSSTISIDASGHVQMSTQLVLAAGAQPIAISGAELRTPVRANDQMVLFDQHVANSGIDADGDGRQDALALAIWRVVVGNESVSLPDLAGTMPALRVDTFVTARVTPSGGSAPQTATSQVSSWYAPGLGVVRTATAGTAGRPLDGEELLLGYDGLTEGWGWMAKEQPSWELGTVLDRPLMAIPLSDGVLVDGGVGFFRLDRNGRRLAYSNFSPNNTAPVRRGLVRYSGGVRTMAVEGERYVVWSIDESTGATGAGVTVDLTENGRNVVSPDVLFYGDPGAPVMWARWERMYSLPGGGVSFEIVLRRLGDGGMVGPEIRIPIDQTSTNVRTRPHSDGLIVTWLDYEPTGDHTSRVVLVLNDGSVAADRSWVTPRSEGSDWPALNVLSHSSTAWLVWGGPTATSAQAVVPHGLRLDAAANPVGMATDTTSLLAAGLNGLTGAMASDGWWLRLSAVGNRWFAFARDFGQLFPDDPEQQTWIDYREFDVGSGAPSGSMQTRMALRIPAERELTIPPIVFSDRVLLLTEDFSQSGLFIRPVVIWRR
jgi:hypothetical protein